MSTEVVAEKKYSPVVVDLAQSLGVSESGLVAVMKKHVFRSDTVTPEDMLAAAIICREYGLNPITKQIHAIPNKGSMLIVVGVDGWVSIVNNHPSFDGVSFETLEGSSGLISCTCIIRRKDRSNPIMVTEYMDECQGTSEPWKRWPKRMLRHKAFIQCARIAFGIGGIIDQDEAERIDTINDPPKKRTYTRTRSTVPIESLLPPPTETITDDGEIIETAARGDLLGGDV